MIVLGLDTATSATAVGVRLRDGTVLERRDDPSPGAHPGHATRLLAMAAELLAEAEISWEQLERVAVGLGPGTFTGLRVGVATARGLAHSRGIELVGVSSLRALALGALEGPGGQALAVIDARRGEVFAAAYVRDPGGVPRELTAAAALAPEGLAELAAAARERGGGAVRSSGTVRCATESCSTGMGLEVPEEGSPLHLVSGGAICVLGAGAAPAMGVRCPTTYVGPTRS